MPEQTVTHTTFVLEYRYTAPLERVFAAFADPKRKRRWFAEAEGRTPELFESDFRVGGRERTRSRMGENTPFPGTPLTNETIYQDIMPNRRIVFAYTMTLGEYRMSASLATVEFLPTENGTEVIFTDQGAYFENSDGPQRRETGWRHLLDGVAKEVIA